MVTVIHMKDGKVYFSDSDNSREEAIRDANATFGEENIEKIEFHD